MQKENVKKDLTIVIPAYNEEKALALFLPELTAFAKKNEYKIIIINDGSKDGTLQVLKQYESDLTIVSHKVNKGYGAAIKSGISIADTRYVITIDADGQHFLEDVGTLHKVIIEKDADMVVGSRAKLKSESFYRRLGKSIIRSIAKMLVPIHIHDINSGMKIYDTELAKKYVKLCPDGMPYSDVIAIVFTNFRHRVLEHDIRIIGRIAGKSTIGTKTAIETIRQIFNIALMFNPLKIFLPISFVLLLFSLIWGLPIIVQGGGVSGGTALLFITSVLFFLMGIIAEQLSLIRKSSVHDE
ncbi:MAG TPA: glycosyltransferase family 2 protein [Bacteroidales bacterium]|nr:glycosyltransferase family 2 protein [Bacteroidales bacterium]